MLLQIPIQCVEYEEPTAGSVTVTVTYLDGQIVVYDDPDDVSAVGSTIMKQCQDIEAGT